MDTRIPLIAVTILFGMLTAAGAAAPLTPLSDTSRTLTTQFTYTATVSAPPAGTKGLAVWLPIPSDSVWQTVSALSVTAPVPYQMTRDGMYGDRMVYLHEEAPVGPLTVKVRFTVVRREVRVLEPLEGMPPTDPTLQASLRPDKRVPVGGLFRTIAQRITTGDKTPLLQEKAIFDSVVDTMQYDYHHSSPEYAQGDSVFVCDYKAGNCSDLHSYLISVSRSIGIPAVLEFGFPLTGIPVGVVPTDGAITGYHCWTWFADPQHGLVPLDAADARRWRDAGRPDVADYLFGDLVLARSAVAMSRGRDIILAPAQKSAPFNYFIYPYAEADGKPLAASWTLTYHLPRS